MEPGSDHLHIGAPDGDISHRARIACEAAKTEYERAQSPVADRIVSQRDFETAKAEYERARLAYEATGRVEMAEV